MSVMASQITCFTNVYSTVCSGTDQRKHQNSTSLASARGIHRWPVNSPHIGPVTRKLFRFDDVIMTLLEYLLANQCTLDHFAGTNKPFKKKHYFLTFSQNHTETHIYNLIKKSRNSIALALQPNDAISIWRYMLNIIPRYEISWPDSVSWPIIFSCPN